MNKILSLTYLLLLTSMFLPASSWAQDINNAASAKDSEESQQGDTDGEPSIKEKKVPIRLSSKLPRTTIALNQKRKMQLLENNLTNGAPTWLSDGEEEFLTIWHEDRSGNAQGALLILHAEGEHPSWPRTTQPLHDSLPEYGWATLAIHLPNPAYEGIPERTLSVKTIPPKKSRDIDNSSDDNSDNESGDEEPKANEQKAEENTPTVEPPTNGTLAERKPIRTHQEIEAIAENRLTAALKFLHDKGQFNIVLMGNGVGAIRGHKLMKSIIPIIDDEKLKKKIEKPIRGSIIFNAKNTLPKEKEIYKDWFFDPDIPILDIYMDTDIRNIKDAKKRKALAKRQKVIIHKQLKLSNLSYETSWKENQLSRRIRSFLVTNVQGIEVENAKVKK
ncbi:hypothetical protein IMCC1989_428 [gamma proteobacterium IMCC1989]|nr:hypothetical protein IMCC1989_428 [gamma proteobacterium IMCC1989]